MATERLLTLAEVAEYLRLNVETVRRYVRSGKLRAVRLGGGRAGYRVPEDEVEKLAGPKWTYRADETAPIRLNWSEDPEERRARWEAVLHQARQIPGNRDLPSIAVEAIREMREENG